MVQFSKRSSISLNESRSLSFNGWHRTLHLCLTPSGLIDCWHRANKVFLSNLYDSSFLFRLKRNAVLVNASRKRFGNIDSRTFNLNSFRSSICLSRSRTFFLILIVNYITKLVSSRSDIVGINDDMPSSGLSILPDSNRLLARLTIFTFTHENTIPSLRRMNNIFRRHRSNKPIRLHLFNSLFKRAKSFQCTVNSLTKVRKNFSRLSVRTDNFLPHLGIMSKSRRIVSITHIGYGHILALFKRHHMGNGSCCFLSTMVLSNSGDKLLNSVVLKQVTLFS